MGHVKNSKLGLGSGWCWVGVDGWVNSGGELVLAIRIGYWNWGFGLGIGIGD